MKILQKLRPYIAILLAVLSIYALIKGGGLDEYFYWFNSLILLHSIVTLIDCLPKSKEEGKETE